MPQLDQPCSKHFTYRQLIECGETWQSSSIDNLPLVDQSRQALADLATHILDPVYEQFTSLEITWFLFPIIGDGKKKTGQRTGHTALHPENPDILSTGSLPKTIPDMPAVCLHGLA